MVLGSICVYDDFYLVVFYVEVVSGEVAQKKRSV